MAEQMMSYGPPSEAARQHMQGKPYEYPEMSDRVRKFVVEQREQKER